MSNDTLAQKFAGALLPESVKRRIRGRPLLQRLLGNGVWQIGDSVFRMGTGVLITVYVARYLGPPGFGLVNFGAALATLFTAVAQFGMNALVVRDLIARPEERPAILGSALLLRLAGGAASIALAVGASALLRPGDARSALVVVIIAATALPRAWDIIDYDYQSRIHSRPVVIARNASYVLFAIVRVLLVLLRAPLEWFALAISAEPALATVLMVRKWWADGLLVSWRSARWRELRYLASTGLPLVVAGLSMTVYMRIDQVMLGRLMGDAGVGLFSAAVKVSEALYFLPMAATASVAPALTAARGRSVAAYERQLIQVMRVLVWVALAVALVFASFAHPIIRALYGPHYAPSAAVLAIHAWAGVLVSLGYCSNLWLNNEGFFRYSMYQTLVGAAVNIMLNLVMIPQLGTVGAALASCVGQLASVMLTTAALPKTRRLLTLQLAALMPLFTPSPERRAA